MKRNIHRFFLLAATAIFLSWSFTACPTSKSQPSNTATLPAAAPSEYPVADGEPLDADFSGSSIEFVSGLKAGWNLGNTLDAAGNWSYPQGLNSETS